MIKAAVNNIIYDGFRMDHGDLFRSPVAANERYVCYVPVRTLCVVRVTMTSNI